MTTRKSRGAQTQRLIAAHLQTNGWPHATDAGAGRPGSDILGTPGLAIEVKARRDFSPLAWIRQAGQQPGLPLVIHRPDGMGPATVGDWPVTLKLNDMLTLLRAAGYGDPPTEGGPDAHTA
jgi:hypothetical protein